MSRNDIPLHRTVMGKQLIEKTLPSLARSARALKEDVPGLREEVARLNTNIEKLNSLLGRLLEEPSDNQETQSWETKQASDGQTPPGTSSSDVP